MLRMLRCRKRDPVTLADPDVSHWGGLQMPELTQDYGHQEAISFDVPVPALYEGIPDLPLRRKLLARDPLACVDGFRVTILLALRHLFGVRVCPFCPECNRQAKLRPCKDVFGSSATSIGGCFGRMDDIDIALEAQKSSGSLHAHGQGFLQCLHQHQPLNVLFDVLQTGGRHLVQDYLKFKAHVSRETYADPELFLSRMDEREKLWPKYEHSTLFLSSPSYLRRGLDGVNTVSDAECLQEGKEWLHTYLAEHVQRLQECKQHHVHPISQRTGVREPLTHCRKKDNPKLCKAGYPKDKELCGFGTVLCRAKCQRMGLPHSGRKNMLGTLHGPRNDSNLNGTHPCLLAALRCNSDVQLPYRFPICETTHDPTCMSTSCLDDDVDLIIAAAQHAQDAQAGYAADYQNKRGPMAFQEIKEIIKGQRKLAESVQDRNLRYITSRLARRFLSDIYGKGVVRSAVECCNLRAYHNAHDITYSETIQLSSTTTLAGADLLSLVEAASANKQISANTSQSIRLGSSKKKELRITNKSIALAYAFRPKHPEIWFLSAYEFTAFFELVLVSFPTSLSDIDNPDHHAELTSSGLEKLRSLQLPSHDDFRPGEDYMLKDVLPQGYHGLIDDTTTSKLRHEVVILQRKRPLVPTFAGSPLPMPATEHTERNAMLMMTYFCAWTASLHFADNDVYYIGRLKADTSWQNAWRIWYDRLTPEDSVQRYVNNFWAVHRLRPTNDVDAVENNEDLLSDEVTWS